MSNEEFTLVGYWNKNKENPELFFKQPDDLDKFELVVVKVIRVYDDLNKNTKLQDELNKLKVSKQKLKKHVKNLENIGKRLK